MNNVVLKKRRLRDERTDRTSGFERSPQEGIAAVEFIRLTTEDSEYVKQAFPRVQRVTRGKKS